MRRILSLWLPSLAIDRWRRHDAAAAQAQPFATIVTQHNRPTVLAVDPLAAMAGVQPNMALADARAVCPHVRVLPACPDLDRALLEKIADWCDRYSPLVAIESYDGASGGLWIDITGCAHLFGGELSLLRDLSRRLARTGLVCRAAIADTPGAAWAIARYAEQRLSTVPSGAQREALAALSVAALRLAPADAALLARLGLPTVEALTTVPRAPLTRRFGVDVARRLDQALGNLPEALSPRRPVAPYEVRRVFAEPIGRPEDVAAGLSRLLQRLSARLNDAALGARALTFTLHRSDGSHATASISTQLPSRNAWHLLRLFAPKLEQLDPDPGVDTLVLAAREVAPFVSQDVVLARVPKSGGERLSVDALIDRLSNHIGVDRVTRFALRARHLPEEQNIRVPALHIAPSIVSMPAASMENLPSAPTTPSPWPPLRLLANPPVVTETGEAENLPVAITWLHRELRIVAAEGPRRVLGRWWAPDHPRDAPARDYMAAVTDSGDTFLLFKDGQRKRWFVHGVMG